MYQQDERCRASSRAHPGIVPGFQEGTSIRRAAGLVCLGVLLGAPTTAGAAEQDLPYRKAVSTESKAGGLREREVQLLLRVPGPGRELVLEQLLARFPSRESRSRGGQQQVRLRYEADRAMARGDGWFLEVRANGEWIRYRNSGYITGPRNFPVSMDVRPPAAVLETMARRWIEDDLSPFVKLQPGEELKGWSASYLVGVEATLGGQVRHSVYASQITLIRVIDGVPVVGPGSKVSVLVANDATLVGFDVDWPELWPSGQSTLTADIDTIRAWAEQRLEAEAGAQRVQERVFECGYYDPGAWLVDPMAPVAPACISVVDPAPGAGILLKDVIPIGIDLWSDQAG